MQYDVMNVIQKTAKAYYDAVRPKDITIPNL